MKKKCLLKIKVSKKSISILLPEFKTQNLT